jgi:hypothetical protein
MAGYSGTPLVAKLGITPGARIGMRHAPEGLVAALQPWPAGATITTPATGPLDGLLLFVREAAVLEAEFAPGAATLVPAGMLWVAWPKKAAKVATDLTEDRVRAIGLAAGLVDVKVCAIDATWSGLKFVRRLADRPGRR